MKMGHRTTQRILDCSDCGCTPEDGEYLWEMCGKYICASCIDKDELEASPDVPQKGQSNEE